MPEGDTVWRTAQRLDAALRGHALVLAELRWGGLDDTGLVGRTTTEVISRGKHLLHRLDDGRTVHSHLQMEGQWRIAHPGDQTRALRQRADLRALFGTEEWTAAGLRLGRLHLLPTSAEHTLVGHLGPDVLDPDWDVERVLANLTAYDGVIGSALLDQRVLAGVGTFWASESLFLQRILPWTQVCELSPPALAGLVDRVRQLMVNAKEHAVPSSTGSYRMGSHSWVHARSGMPCRRCGETVRVAAIGQAPRERVMFSCPRCQGGLAPTDDGREQAPLGAAGRTGPGARVAGRGRLRY